MTHLALLKVTKVHLIEWYRQHDTKTSPKTSSCVPRIYILPCYICDEQWSKLWTRKKAWYYAWHSTPRSSLHCQYILPQIRDLSIHYNIVQVLLHDPIWPADWVRINNGLFSESWSHCQYITWKDCTQWDNTTCMVRQPQVWMTLSYIFTIWNAEYRFQCERCDIMSSNTNTYHLLCQHLCHSTLPNLLNTCFSYLRTPRYLIMPSMVNSMNDGSM